MWKSITNPINGKKVIVDSMEGRTLIKSYLKNLKGGSDIDHEKTKEEIFQEIGNNENHPYNRITNVIKFLIWP